MKNETPGCEPVFSKFKIGQPDLDESTFDIRWKELEESIKEYGIRNTHTHAVAPGYEETFWSADDVTIDQEKVKENFDKLTEVEKGFAKNLMETANFLATGRRTPMSKEFNEMYYGRIIKDDENGKD